MNIPNGSNEKQKDQLNEKQWEVVRHKDGPLLVIAGPGTGKTKVITHRIEHLIREHNIKPEKILAITFTNKAAQEMRDRVNSEIDVQRGDKVKIFTFHAFCYRILREHTSEIELDEDFKILSQEDQEDLLIEIVENLNFNKSTYGARRLLNIINNFKSNLRALTETSEFYEDGIRITDEDDVTKIRSISEAYQEGLDERNALDFDDLIFKTIELFEKSDDVKKDYRDEISYVLVDEYHDVNKAQYQLLQLLCAPPAGNLMVVADKDQAIYSWRGSDPKYIDDFCIDFNPRVIGLEQHYRCTETILSAAKAVIAENSDPSRPSLLTDEPIGEKIVHCTFGNQDKFEEAQNIIKLVRNLKANSRADSDSDHQPDSIAILYRKHEHADILADQLALQEDIPFRRWTQFTNPFQEVCRRSLISYLSLAASETFSAIEHAINFPDVCINELTLLQLKQLARLKKVSLVELLKNIEEYPENVGPLTCEKIRQFWERIHQFVTEIKIGNKRASEIVKQLLDILESARSPYSSEELDIIEKNRLNVMNIAEARDILHRAVESGDRIHITVSYGIDEYCAAHILRQSLEMYLNRTVQVQFLLPGVCKPQITEKGVHVLIGDFGELQEEITDTRVLLIGKTNNESAKVLQLEESPVSEDFSNFATVRSITALKLCQYLIGSFEIRNMEDVVVYDLETTGLNPKTAEIVEIAAHRLNTKGDKVDDYSQLVKPPDGYIPEESTEVHGISEEHVKDMPSIKTVLPKFCEFIENSILVGHNISRYDNRILERNLTEHLDPNLTLTNLYYDTLVTARRFFPRERRSLEALAVKFDILDKLNIQRDDLHRAKNDIRVNREIFKKLVDIDFQKREIKSLTEFLPFVGLSILAKTAALEQVVTPTAGTDKTEADEGLTEVNAFLNAAKRSVQNHGFRNSTVDLRQKVDLLLLEETEKNQIGTFIGELYRSKPRNSPEDIEWKSERANMIKEARCFEEISRAHGLSSFLEYQTRMMNAVRRFEEIGDKGENAHEQTQSNISHEPVTLMSLHTAKGTEFDVVIILGMEDGIFPEIWHWRSEAIQEERLKEERRLFYVAMTRAKKRLYLSTSMYRFYEKQGDRFLYDRATSYSSEDQNRAASVFIREIPSDYIQKWPPQE